MPRLFRQPSIIPLAAVIVSILVSRAGATDDVTTKPPFDHFIVIPVRIHVLTSDDLPDANCALTDDQLKHVTERVNGVWNKAGIHFGIESIVREPAAGVAEFNAVRDRMKQRTPLGAYRLLAPADSKLAHGMNVYFIHDFSVNGVYLGDGVAFVKETAALREVEGGIDEPLPRVMSHELGHALGLAHRQNRTNLMASGTTGTSVNEAEVERARNHAVALEGNLRVNDLERRARESAENESHDQRDLWRSWLSEIPRN